jgi:ribonuclease-3 family protein
MDMHARVCSALPACGLADPAFLPALTLAYVGDTVYDLFVRTMLVHGADVPVHALHVAAAECVCAKGQAEAYFRIEPLLTEEERAVFRRGRNAHSGSVPKNARMADYRSATGLECLIGYLYLTRADERLCALMRVALQADSPTRIKESDQKIGNDDENV